MTFFVFFLTDFGGVVGKKVDDDDDDDVDVDVDVGLLLTLCTTEHTQTCLSHRESQGNETSTE